MSERAPQNRRRSARAFTDFDCVLTESSGRALDARATAHDLSVRGFRAETRARLQEGQTLRFLIHLPRGATAAGEGEVVWAGPDQLGNAHFGVRIVSMGWRDRTALRELLHPPGYDFVGLAQRCAWAAFWIVVALGLQSVMLRLKG